jgi:hypothetical protein
MRARVLSFTIALLTIAINPSKVGIEETPFFASKKGSGGPASCQACESSVWNRGVFGPFIGPKRQASGCLGISGERGPKVEGGSRDARPPAAMTALRQLVSASDRPSSFSALRFCNRICPGYRKLGQGVPRRPVWNVACAYRYGINRPRRDKPCTSPC